MSESLKRELDRRARDGYRPVTMDQLRRTLDGLGYAVAVDMHADSDARHMTGEAAGESYPVRVLYVVEKDTRRSAFHYESRRDANFRALQAVRFDGSLFAVVRNRFVEL